MRDGFTLDLDEIVVHPAGPLQHNARFPTVVAGESGSDIALIQGLDHNARTANKKCLASLLRAHLFALPSILQGMMTDDVLCHRTWGLRVSWRWKGTAFFLVCVMRERYKEEIQARACLISTDGKKRRRASARSLIDNQECHAEPPGEGLYREIVCPYTSWQVQTVMIFLGEKAGL